MSRLQVGGLALIVGYTINPHNLGRVVELESFIEYGIFEDTGERFYSRWMVIADGLLGVDGSPVDFLVCEPKTLLPLGDKQTQEILRQEEKEKCY